MSVNYLRTKLNIKCHFMMKLICSIKMIKMFEEWRHKNGIRFSNDSKYNEDVNYSLIGVKYSLIVLEVRGGGHFETVSVAKN